MNLKQLENAEDSLKQLYDKRLSSFQKVMLKSNLLRNESSSSNNLLSQQPIHTDQKKFDFDSIFNSLSIADKKMAINQALVYARSAKSQLSSSKEELLNRKKLISKHEVEWHRKFTLSFACFIFFFIGAPLGAIIRKGGLGMPAVISVIFFLIYYIISISGEKFVKEGLLSTGIGMWISSFLLFPIGIFLTYKATTDSVILNIDTYLEFFKKIARFFKLES